MNNKYSKIPFSFVEYHTYIHTHKYNLNFVHLIYINIIVLLKCLEEIVSL